jgi:rod shape-determining protein MreD
VRGGRLLDRGLHSRVMAGFGDIVVGAVLIVVATLLQVAVVVDFGIVGGRPDIVVILVIAIALVRGPMAGALAGFGAGFLVDTLGLGLVGISSLVFVGVGYLVGVWGERMAGRATLRPLAAVAGASMLADLASLAIAILLGAGSTIEPGMISAAVIGAMLNVLLAIALFPLVRRVLRPRRRRAEPAPLPPASEGIIAA